MRRIENGGAGGLHGGENGGEQEQARSDRDAAGLVAPHLFLAQGAELLSILRTLASPYSWIRTMRLMGCSLIIE